MSRYNETPLSFEGLKTVPIEARGGKVGVQDFARVYKKGDGVMGLLESLPRILAGDRWRGLLEAMVQAKAKKRAILWGIGGHVVKCGLADVLLDLMHRGWVTGFVMNGAASIHDFEIAIAGQTSEDVEAVLPDGRFGAAEETGREMNLAIVEGDSEGLGMGEALGKRVSAIANPEFAGHSLLCGARIKQFDSGHCTRSGGDGHAAYTHPQADGRAIGSATHRDFRLLCSLVKGLDQGGVYLNIGSAVVLPEVFLKAVSVVRNLGNPLANFTTANFDFLEHYRPEAECGGALLHARSGGKGYAITGHHELMIPLLAAALIESE